MNALPGGRAGLAELGVNTPLPAMGRYTSFAAPLVGALAIIPAASAQCEGRWLEGTGAASFCKGGPAHESMPMTSWDLDGTGPAPEVFVLGAPFNGIGRAVATNVAMLHAGEWSAMGEGLWRPMYGTQPRAFAQIRNARGGHDLIAAGTFTQSGDRVVGRVARWDGTAWQRLGSPATGEDVTAVAVVADGQGVETLYCASARRVWRRGATAWESVGPVFEGLYPVVSWMGPWRDASGHEWLIVGGTFLGAAGVPFQAITRWDGQAWQAFDDQLTGISTRGLIVRSENGPDTVYAGGFNLQAGGTALGLIARRDGQGWSQEGWSLANELVTFSRLRSGELIASTVRQVAGFDISRVSRRRNGLWEPMGSEFVGRVTGLGETPDGTIIAGGNFSRVGLSEARYIARWASDHWTLLDDGLSDGPDAMVATSDGGFLFGGSLEVGAGGASYLRLAKWTPDDGGQYLPLAGGIADHTSIVQAALTLRDGSTIIGGSLAQVGGVAIRYVGRWDGLAWTPVGSDMYAPVTALCELRSGEIIAAASGATHAVYSTSGGAWTRLGDTFNNTVRALTETDDGTLIAVGEFTQIAGTTVLRAARWTGTTWVQVGAGFDAPVWALIKTADGRIIAGGSMTHSGAVATRYTAVLNGDAWTPIGAGPTATVQALCEVDAEIWAGMRSPSDRNYLTRWNGSAWQAPAAQPDDDVACIVRLRGGDVVMGGEFFRVGGVVSYGWARWTTRPACPVDMNCDGFADFLDLDAFLGLFESGTGGSDFNADGFVDFLDYADFVDAWGRGCG